MVFQSSQYFDQNFFGFWEETSARGCQNCIRRVQMKALSICFGKKIWFCVIFAPWAEKFRTFAKHLRQGFQNINLSVTESFKKLNIFQYFLYFEEKFSDFERKNSKQGFRTHILPVHENILKKLPWKNDGFSVNLVTWANFFGTLCKNL